MLTWWMMEISLSNGLNINGLNKSFMKKLKTEFRVFFNPKETWFILPLFMVDYEWGRLTICIGWLCFGAGLEIEKEDE